LQQMDLKMILKNKTYLIVLIIALAAISRLIPHPLNFTPIAALGLFGAAHLKPRWLAFAIPFVALWLSDIILMNGPLGKYYQGFQWFGHIWVYSAFLIIIGIGFLIRGKVSFLNIIGASLGSSILFFLITNLGVWLGSAVYPQNISGLLMSYIAGIPFFWNTLAGDLFYCSVLFGSYAWYSKKYEIRQKTRQGA